MNYLSREYFEDRDNLVKIIAFADVGYGVFMMLVRAMGIITRTQVDEKESLISRENQSTLTIVLTFILSVCFMSLHISLALKLYIALLQKDSEVVASARNAKAWQNWSIVFFIVLIGDLISNILSADTLLQVVLMTVFIILEMCWRLFAIYKVGLFIDELLEKIPCSVPTLQFFGVRIPAPQDYNVTTTASLEDESSSTTTTSKAQKTRRSRSQSRR